MTINIAVRNKYAKQTCHNAYVCGNTDYDVVFDFDAEWDSHTAKTARYEWDGQYIDVVFSGNTCPMPRIDNASVIKVGVYAGDLSTTTPAYLQAVKSILSETGTQAEPTPDVYAQIMAAIDSGALKGQKGDKGDKGDQGEQGIQGLQGVKGDKGEQGLQGIQGDKGDKGDKGDTGATGAKGDKGDKGEPFTLADFEASADYQAIVAAEEARQAAEAARVASFATYDSRVTANESAISSLNVRVDILDNRVSILDSAQYLRLMDGTKATYDRLMRQYFRENNAESKNQYELTTLVEQWYAGLRYGWNGWSTFKQPDLSTASEGVRGGDNVGMVCIPSSATEANRDDYAGLPLFAVSTVNWIVDDSGEQWITAIEGITPNFERDNQDKYVGVMQMMGYKYWYEDDTSYTRGYTDLESYAKEHERYTPLPECVRLDGSVRQFALHGKYMASILPNGKMTCCAGVMPSAYISQNQLVDQPRNNGAMYSGGTVLDWSFLVTMTEIKYCSLTQDNNIQGAVQYNYQHTAAVSETNTNRVLITTAQGANWLQGCGAIIGTNESTDRGAATAYSISGKNGIIVKSIENVVVDGTTYTALYFDKTFDTTAGTTMVSSFHFPTGYNDTVLGNDGQRDGLKNGRNPALLQGIEYSVGGYEVFADVILNLDGENYEPYYVTRREHQAKTLTANYIASGMKSPQPETDSWTYTRKEDYNGHFYFQTDTGTASNQHTKDGFYKNRAATKGFRVWLSFAYLWYGVGNGGLSSLNGNAGLSWGSWRYLARLSPNGSRGEFAA